MMYLYVKTHNVTGLKYLGKTNAKDPFKYKGSGKYWKRHLKIHGNDVTTKILLQTDDKDCLSETGIFFSKLWNIVESSDWANLKLESGDGGWDHIDSKNKIVSEETRKKMSIASSNRQIGEKNSFYGKTHTSETKQVIAAYSKERGKELYEKRISDGNHPNNTCICPKCGKSGQYRAMKRWHFSNCKN